MVIYALYTISYRESLSVSFSYTTLPFPRCLFPNIMLLPLYRSPPCRGVRSRRVASAVLNLDDGGGAAINRRLIKE